MGNGRISAKQNEILQYIKEEIIMNLKKMKEGYIDIQ